MNASDLRSQLEEDLLWRQEELRQLRNNLLGDTVKDNWPAWALRSLLVMQYAHLEGFTQSSLSLYIAAVNERGLSAAHLRVELVVSALAAEFKVLRTGDGAPAEDANELLLRRAKRQVDLVRKMRSNEANIVQIQAEHAIALEMNLGARVLKKNLFMLGIPEDAVDESTYGTLEFVRRNRNDIAHGSRREVIPPGLFESHWETGQKYMEGLIRLVTTAVRDEWFRVETPA